MILAAMPFLSAVQDAIPDGRVFGLDAQTLVGVGIQLFNVLLLAGLLTYILYKPVRKYLQGRTDKIAGQLDRAQEAMAEANAAKALYNQRLEEIERERLEVLESARKLGVEKRNEILNAVKKETDAMRERVKVEMQREQERVSEEMKLFIIETSSAMAEKILSHAIDKETQDKLFTDTIAELDESPWLN